MHFHPDRAAGSRPILAKMAEDGAYRSQFVTGTSNGGLTAHPGGDRWRWESHIFMRRIRRRCGRPASRVRGVELPS